MTLQIKTLPPVPENLRYNIEGLSYEEMRAIRTLAEMCTGILLNDLYLKLQVQFPRLETSSFEHGAISFKDPQPKTKKD